LKSRNTPSSSESLALDDASTLESAGSGSPLVHGLAIDTISRSVPTKVLPLYVRESLFRAWPGMNGNVVRGARSPADQATSSLIPWYSYDTQGNNLVESVAERLTIDSHDAERWFQDGTGRVGNYADMPLNDAAIERLAFWRYDPDANEFDPSMMLEPQVYAHDQLSQLFTECCSFHFGFLADVDSEYHRLRSGGVVAQFDEDGVEYEPWYRLYHYWRNVVETVYLGGHDQVNPQVRLPQHLRNGNWRIKDVLDELEARLTGTSGFIHNDMIVTGKGYTRGLQTVTLGLQPDAKYLDGDGNSRFYLPYLQRASQTDLSFIGLSANSAFNATQLVPGEGLGNDEYGEQIDYSLSTSATATGSVALDELSVGPMWQAYASIIAAASGSNALPLWSVQLNAALDQVDDLDPTTAIPFFGDGAIDQGRVFTGFNYIYSLPINGQLSHSTLGNDYNYWTGHCLNLFEFIEFMRYVGQSTEPEVIDKLIVPMGIVVAVDAFKARSAGASCNHLDELYNLYESQSSFNENPARKFTAAHLGPTQHVIPSDQTDPRSLSLRGNVLSTSDSSGNLLTARERYWTPGSLDTGTANQVAAAFLPGVVLKTTLYPNLNIEALAAVDDNTLREFLSRALGTVSSMRTKVEKPVFLPAGKTGPESTYASGVGVGALQLVHEVIYALSGGKPRFGLGYGGFSDINMESNSIGDIQWWTEVTRAEAQDLNSAIVALNQASDLNSLIDAISSLGYPGPSDILSAGLSAAIDGSVVANKYKAAINWNTARVDPASGQTPGGFGRGAGEVGLLDDHGHTSTDVSTSSYWRRLSISPSHFLAQATRGAGASVQIQKFALPHSVEIGMPVLATISAPDMATAFTYEGIHYSGNGVQPTNVTWQDGTQFWRIDVIPEGIEMYSNVDTANGGAPLASIDLVSETDGSIYLPATANASGIAQIIPDRLNIPYEAGSSPDHGVHIAHASLANIWNNGTIGTSFQVHGFDAASHAAGVQVNHRQMPFTTNRTLLRPTELIRTYGADMWTEWFQSAALNDQVPLNEVAFRLKVGIYVVDQNAGGLPLASLPAVGSCSQAQGVWRLGHTDWLMGILDRSPSLPTLSQSDIGVSASGTFTPAFVGHPRDVVLNGDVDWNEGSHVYFLGSSWTEDAEYAAWKISRGLLREWAFDYITDWAPPVADGTALDYSIWQSFVTTPDHPVSRMKGTWSSMVVDCEVDGNTEKAWVEELVSNVTSSNLPTPWQKALFPGTFRNTGALASVSGELAYKHFSSASGTGVHSTYPTWHGGELIIPSSACFTPTYVATYLAEHTLGRGSGSRAFSFGPTAMVDSTSGRSIDCIHNFDNYQTGENWGNYFGAMSAFADEAFSCVTYVYPDLPSYKMRFRPFRRIADATLMMEQKLTFMNDGEDVSPLAGPLGIKVIGTPTQFRFADLVDAGQPETYLLEPVRTRTRLIDPSHRSVLTFTKLALLDEDSQTHTIPDVVMTENQKSVTLGNKHASGATSSSKVYNRNTIRDIQLGRQFQRLG